MVNDIIKYIEFLEKELGVYVSIHNSNSNTNAAINKLTPYNIHRNPFCLFVKERKERHEKCLEHQSDLRKERDGGFFVCPYGASQFVFPLRHNEESFGFICVGAYKGERKDACESVTDIKALKEKAEHLLSAESIEKERINMLIKPLCAMLILYLENSPDLEVKQDSDLYRHILSVIHANVYEKELTVKIIADACFCSVSTVAHVFKQNSAQSLNQYVTKLKMEKAENMLINTNESITEIAYSCGYTDSNYFICVFGRIHGISPLKYRKLYRKSIN